MNSLIRLFWVDKNSWFLGVWPFKCLLLSSVWLFIRVEYLYLPKGPLWVWRRKLSYLQDHSNNFLRSIKIIKQLLLIILTYFCFKLIFQRRMPIWIFKCTGTTYRLVYNIKLIVGTHAIINYTSNYKIWLLYNPSIL